MYTLHGTLGIWRSRLALCCLPGILWLSAGCSDEAVSVTEPAPGPRPAFAIVDVLQQLGLEVLPGPVPTYFSPGSRERAEDLQARLRPAVDFWNDRMKLDLPITLAVLNPAHWAAISPSPYGIPGNNEPEFLVFVPSEPDKAVVTQLYNAARVALPEGAAADLARLGITYEDAVLLGLDLIGLFHETGHVYNAALGYRRGQTRHWFREFLATYTAYTYLELAQPSWIVVWNALSEALIEFVAQPPISRSLDFLPFSPLGLTPAGYGWFQSHFNLRADVVVRQRPRATWFPQLAAAGLDHGTLDIPTSELLHRLQGFKPGFTAWADAVGFEYQ